MASAARLPRHTRWAAAVSWSRPTLSETPPGNIGEFLRYSEEWRGRKIMPHFLWPEPLSPAQLKRLEEHKYSASGRSLFEPPCQIYWNWLVQQIPTWIAPNTLTIVGLLVNILSTLVLVYYCPTATEEVSIATGAKVSNVYPSLLWKDRPPFRKCAG